MNQPVITAYNVISPLGLNRQEFAERMFNGESGVRDLTGIVNDPDFPVGCAGLLPTGVFPPIELNDFSGEVTALIEALFRPYTQGGEELGEIDGVIYGANNGIAKFADIQKFHSKLRPKADHLRQELGLNLILRKLEARGQSLFPENAISMANGCITGLAAVTYAAQRIRTGQNRRILVVCDEIRVRPEDLLKYNALGALSRDRGRPEKVSRPFSLGRQGFVKGEGAGLVVIEEKSFAERGDRPILASIEGYGISSDAWRLTDGREDLKGMCSAIEKAIAMAHIEPAQIDYINAHGTSTPNNDLLETLGIKKVFGDHAYQTPVSSLKSQIGHLNFACGLVELIACVVMLEHQKVAPTINFERDSLCDLNYVPDRSEKRPLTYILKNSFGFGGANAAMILKR